MIEKTKESLFIDHFLKQWNPYKNQWIPLDFFQQCRDFTGACFRKITQFNLNNEALQVFFTAIENHLQNVIEMHGKESIQHLQVVTMLRMTLSNLKDHLLQQMPEDEQIYYEVFRKIKYSQAIAGFLSFLNETKQAIKQIPPGFSPEEINHELLVLIEKASLAVQGVDISNLGYPIFWGHFDQLIPLLTRLSNPEMIMLFSALQENYPLASLLMDKMGMDFSEIKLLQILSGFQSVPKKEDIERLKAQDEKWGKIYENLADGSLIWMLKVLYAKKSSGVFGEKEYSEFLNILLESIWPIYNTTLIAKKDLFLFNAQLYNSLKEAHSHFSKQPKLPSFNFFTQENVDTKSKHFGIDKDKLEESINSENLLPIINCTQGVPLIKKLSDPVEQALIYTFVTIASNLLGIYEMNFESVEKINGHKVYYPPEKEFIYQDLPGFQEEVLEPSLYFIKGATALMIQFPKPLLGHKLWYYPYPHATISTIINNYNCDLIAGFLNSELSQEGALPMGIKAVIFTLNYGQDNTAGECSITYENGEEVLFVFNTSHLLTPDKDILSLDDIFDLLISFTDLKNHEGYQNFEDTIKSSVGYVLLSGYLLSFKEIKESISQTTTFHPGGF